MEQKKIGKAEVTINAKEFSQLNNYLKNGSRTKTFMSASLNMHDSKSQNFAPTKERESIMKQSHHERYYKVT